MQYSVASIMEVRDKFRDPPFPNFSLDELCRRQVNARTKLRRSEHAWNPQVTAKSTEDWVNRLMNGSLNKLSVKNYDALIAKMKTREVFSTAAILENVADIIFNKVLNEPENSTLLARACNDLATYELSLKKPNERVSELREALLKRVKGEFRVMERKPDAAKEANMDREELDLIKSQFVKRKRANVRFAGEMYIVRLIASSSITQIIEVLVDTGKNKWPPAFNLELFSELMGVCGSQVDTEKPSFLNPFFSTVARVKSNESDYPARIRFMMMDLLELRAAKWAPRPALQPTKVAGSSGGKRAAAPPSRQWRGAAAAKPSGPPTSALAATYARSAAAKKEAAKKEAAAGSGSSGAPSSSAAPARPAVEFKSRVKSMLLEWLDEGTNDFVVDWIAEFGDCDRAFTSNEEVVEAVALELVEVACCSSRANAQKEAYAFMTVGLDLEDDEMFNGFAAAVANAVDDGLLTDVPLYAPRFMGMLQLMSAEGKAADIYFDACKILWMAYNALSSVDEYSREGLMAFWDHLPPLPQELLAEGGTVDFPVMHFVCDIDAARNAGLERFVAEMIASLRDKGIIQPVTLQEFLDYEEGNELYDKVREEYRALAAAAEAPQE